MGYLTAIEAKVSKIIYRNDNNQYSILLARIDGEIETLVGYFPVVNEGMFINFFGKKEFGKNKKEQYKVDSYSIVLPKSNDELYKFLINDFINMNLDMASVVIDKIGIKYLDKYQDTDFIKSSVGEEYYNKKYKDFSHVAKSIFSIKNKLLIMENMINMGFGSDISSKVAFSDYEIDSKSLSANPYQLIFPFDLSFYMVDKIALSNGINYKDEVRILEGICYLLDEGVSKYAHIYLTTSDLFTKVNRLLNLRISTEEFKHYIGILEKEKRVFNDIEDNIYGYKYYQAELNLSLDLYRLRDGEKEEALLVEKIKNDLKSDDFSYSEEQEKAIIQAIEQPLLIISGAAGTGKTTVLRKIIELLDKHKNKGKKENDDDYYNIALCAPTGKAAERMKEITGMDARTIHSLLNIDLLFKVPLYNERNPLPVNCLIIDEASMNDTLLFSYVLNATKSGCKVIIVGDEHQLPSLGPGNVLAELLKSPEFVSVTLSRVYRQGKDSTILDLAEAIKEGNKEITNIVYRKTPDFSFIEQRNPNVIADIIVKTVDILFNKSKLDFYKDVQVVTPIHKSVLGTIELNKRIQQLLNTQKKRKKVSIGDKTFYVGDKVIHTKNNNDKKTYNGEVGRVASITNKTLKVTYTSGKDVEYTGEELFELELGFVLSAHKMQGSESAVVIAPVHHVLGNMLQRKLLYTVVTRAKQKLIILGEISALVNGIDNDLSDLRNCNLELRLQDSKLNYLLK